MGVHVWQRDSAGGNTFATAAPAPQPRPGNKRKLVWTRQDGAAGAAQAAAPGAAQASPFVGAGRQGSGGAGPAHGPPQPCKRARGAPSDASAAEHAAEPEQERSQAAGGADRRAGGAPVRAGPERDGQPDGAAPRPASLRGAAAGVAAGAGTRPGVGRGSADGAVPGRASLRAGMPAALAGLWKARSQRGDEAGQSTAMRAGPPLCAEGPQAALGGRPGRPRRPSRAARRPTATRASRPPRARGPRAAPVGRPGLPRRAGPEASGPTAARPARPACAPRRRSWRCCGARSRSASGSSRRSGCGRRLAPPRASIRRSYGVRSDIHLCSVLHRAVCQSFLLSCSSSLQGTLSLMALEL